MIVRHSKDKKYHTSVSHSIKTVFLDNRVRIFNLNTFQYLPAGKPFCFCSKMTETDRQKLRLHSFQPAENSDYQTPSDWPGWDQGWKYRIYYHKQNDKEICHHHHFLNSRELKVETFSGRRRPEWQSKPGTEAAVASIQNSNIKGAVSHALRMLNALKSVQPNKKSNWSESPDCEWKSFSSSLIGVRFVFYLYI